jgi:hypothetical protein
MEGSLEGANRTQARLDAAHRTGQSAFSFYTSFQEMHLKITRFTAFPLVLGK